MKTDQSEASKKLIVAERKLEEAQNEIREAKKMLTKEPIDIMERIQTLDDIYEILGITKEEALPFKNPRNDDERYKNARELVELIPKAYNQGKKPVAKDIKEYKYIPWHLITPDSSEPSGFGFSSDDCTLSATTAFFAFRLAFLDSNHAVDAGK